MERKRLKSTEENLIKEKTNFADQLGNNKDVKENEPIENSRRIVIELAALSRILIIILQILFNYLVPDHDAHVFNPPPTPSVPSPLDRAVQFCLDGLRRWDAVYFLHIAEHGYVYENTLAFFPLFPLAVRAVSYFPFYPLQSIMSYFNVLLVSAVCVNLLFFILSCLSLYELSYRLFNNDALARRATLLYCLNPASIFFTAPYSEAMFAFFTFTMLLQIQRQRIILATVLAAFSGCVRSNGLVNIGFIVYSLTSDLVSNTTSAWRKKQSVTSMLRFLIQFVACLVVSLVISTSLFLCYQYYAYDLHCKPSPDYLNSLPSHVIEYGRKNGYVFPHSTPSPWCSHTLPLSYSYIQNHYWKVGLFEYYQFKQIPNFLLASPMLGLCVYAVLHYVRNNPTHCLHLGLGDQDQEQDHISGSIQSAISRYYRWGFVYVVHLSFLVLFSALLMHVQVATRFIASSSPFIYWFIAIIRLPFSATITSKNLPSSHCSANPALENLSSERQDVNSAALEDMLDLDVLNWHDSCFNKFIIVYFMLYTFLGTAMFSNFLPWT